MGPGPELLRPQSVDHQQDDLACARGHGAGRPVGQWRPGRIVAEVIQQGGHHPLEARPTEVRQDRLGACRTRGTCRRRSAVVHAGPPYDPRNPEYVPLGR